MEWVEDFLPPGYYRKRMFGGVAYYVGDLLVLLTFEGTGSRAYRGVKYPFELWNGCMFPVEKDRQPEVFRKHPYLISHPVLGKWLYLPAESENFEANAEEVLKELRRFSPLFGTVPKPKRKGKRLAEKELDTRRPAMFRDPEPADLLRFAKKISDLRNLGAVMEKTLIRAGVRTPAQFKKIGWKKTLARLAKLHPRYAHAIYAQVLIGALQNLEWNRISPDCKTAAKEFAAVLRKPKKRARKKK